LWRHERGLREKGGGQSDERGDAVRGDAVRGDAVRGDAVRGDAVRDAVRGEGKGGEGRGWDTRGGQQRLVRCTSWRHMQVSHVIVVVVVVVIPHLPQSLGERNLHLRRFVIELHGNDGANLLFLAFLLLLVNFTIRRTMLASNISF
jgi:hypothetical protein